LEDIPFTEYEKLSGPQAKAMIIISFNNKGVTTIEKGI
jgi:hypothetical protein